MISRRLTCSWILRVRCQRQNEPRLALQRSAADSFQESERLNPVDKNNWSFDAILRGAMSQTPNGVSPECPDPAILAAYYDRSVNAAERARLENHIADCARCQMQLAAIAHSDAVASDTLPARRLVTTMRGWRIVIPALAAAAALIVTILTVRPGHDDLRNQQMAAVATHAAPLADFSRSLLKHEAVGTASESQTAGPAASAPASSIGALAMNEPRRAQRPETDQPSEFGEPGGRAKTLAKQKRLEGKTSETAAAEVGGGTESNKPSVSVYSGESPPVVRKSDELAAAPRAVPVAPALTAPAGSAPGASTGPVTLNRLDTAPEAGSAATFSPRMLGTARGVNSGSGGVPVALASISSPDRTTTWIVGRNGTILLRDAAGNTRAERSGVTTDLTAGAAASSQVCWVVGRSGTIVRTIDGEHWELVPSPTRDNLVSVAADSADNAIVTVAGGQSFATSDGGRSWHPQ